MRSQLEILVRIEFRTVGRQIFHSNELPVALQPLLHGPGMMHPQVVHNHDDFAPFGSPHDLPKELEDSARIDGCGRFRVYWHIALPLARPAIAVLAIFNILAVWNEYLLAMLVLSDKELMPLQRGLMVFQGAHITQYPLLMAGIVITVLPVLVVYLTLQKHIIKGITAGAVKG